MILTITSRPYREKVKTAYSERTLDRRGGGHYVSTGLRVTWWVLGIPVFSYQKHWNAT